MITGAGSGLGRTLALKFAKLGWKVLISDLFLERATETEKMVNEAGGMDRSIKM
ncbi:MAG: SDR family NAD(P)-dependent oxidoreductase [Dissulfuribacterales bacterium]